MLGIHIFYIVKLFPATAIVLVKETCCYASFKKKEIIIKKRNKISRILHVIQLSDRVYNVTFPA